MKKVPLIQQEVIYHTPVIVDAVVKEVCKEYNLLPEDFYSYGVSSQRRIWMEPKQIMQYLCDRLINPHCYTKEGKLKKLFLIHRSFPLELLGKCFNCKHCTVIYTLSTVCALRESHPHYKARVDKLYQYFANQEAA